MQLFMLYWIYYKYLGSKSKQLMQSIILSVVLPIIVLSKKEHEEKKLFLNFVFYKNVLFLLYTFLVMQLHLPQILQITNLINLNSN